MHVDKLAVALRALMRLVLATLGVGARQAEATMKTLESKLDSLANVMGVPSKQAYLKRTSNKA